MNLTVHRLTGALVVIAFGVCLPTQGHAALYAGWGTLAWNRDGPDFSVCFPGDSVDTRPGRVVNVLDHMRHFEWAANIKFHPPGNKSIRVGPVTGLKASDWRCPAQSNAGDIKILLYTEANKTWWNTDPVGGAGCSIINPNSSWGATGNEPHLSAGCNFNVKLGDDAPAGTSDFYLNHTLHEIGHKLGFGHEHDRNDAICNSAAGTYKGSIVNGATSQNTIGGKTYTSDPQIFMTPFDKASVMNYVIAACGTKGNYDFTGLSGFDRLALRILYPENNRVAELAGVRVIRTGQRLVLSNLWRWLGAMVDTSANSVAKKFSWRIDGVEVAGSPDLNLGQLAAGTHTLQYAYRDFRGRIYSGQYRVEVLSQNAFSRRMASQAALTGALLN